MEWYPFDPAILSLFFILTLSLLMALVLGANYHNFAFSFDYLAFVAHRFYRRSYLHFCFLR